MSPEDPVVEENEVDVELHCNLLDGHPSKLHSVFWYKDGQPFRYMFWVLMFLQASVQGDP